VGWKQAAGPAARIPAEMIRLIGIVISIGLADSLNPSTLAPALYMAAGPHPRMAVTQFTAAVFSVYLLGGAFIMLGPGQLVLSLVPKPDASTRQILEVLAGSVLIAVGVLLLRNRKKLADKPLPQVKAGGRASWVIGATITAVELPTAFPYFGALAAIVGSGLGFVNRVILLLLFNVCFVLPLIGIIVVLEVAPDSADAVLGRARDFLQRHWPVLLAVVAIIAGGITVALGATGTWRQARRALRKAVSAAV
jgi:cytochrome c biogenesis protein CcdA